MKNKGMVYNFAPHNIPMMYVVEILKMDEIFKQHFVIFYSPLYQIQHFTLFE